MKHRFLLATATFILSCGLAYAHIDGYPWGTPKPYCEDVTRDAWAHDYGQGLSVAYTSGGIDASVPPCPWNPAWDGHYEFALGGTQFLACEALCGPEATGAGATICFGTYADHGEWGFVSAYDNVLTLWGANVFFYVAADYSEFPPIDPSEPDCGDGIVEPCSPATATDVDGLTCHSADQLVTFVNWGSIPFRAGADGSYKVFIDGTSGHLSLVGGSGGGGSGGGGLGSRAGGGGSADP